MAGIAPPSGGERGLWSLSDYARLDVATSARVWDYLAGGKTHYPADRLVGEQLLAVAPDMGGGAEANRAFLGRAVRMLASEGICQFLDVGTGMPAEPYLHEIARAVIPETRMIYMDHDPVVSMYGMALLRGYPARDTLCFTEDLREPERVLRECWLLDLDAPVGLLLGTVLDYCADTDNPAALVAELVEALAPGSYLVLSHGTGDFRALGATAAVEDIYQGAGITLRPRSRGEIQALIPPEMELLDPGVQMVHRWRPEDTKKSRVADAQVAVYGLVAYKP
ncbi:SAM-dependent methyltransferase [Frankia sp. AgB1.9]|uniref:SAM-dependent methyltransferase n=1 Tax=unclassified Frankia TaxID=2632575 RepID=UPI0019313436|nr:MULTISPECIES: SAM-dependent methyltransferase [unclassified Frankia]MBL7490224.1 SAM-dependent methyltransferase [Frankia sp. AgW1.1]MBL7548645.1 SAM-dependent methyltransferase [Frankia sp. AgB1.9]MBL7623504.1 SAM-dependent methyltransferase [Frankia sp. AgB1.8]